jgi:hypothetical protein
VSLSELSGVATSSSLGTGLTTISPRKTILSQYVFTIGPIDQFVWSDQPFLFQCEAEVAMVAAPHDRLCALELDITLADFVGKSIVAGAQ